MESLPPCPVDVEVAVPIYAILEAPSRLGLSAEGVELLPEALLEAGLGERLDAAPADRLVAPANDPRVDPGTGILNPVGLRDYSARLADAVGASIDRGEFPIVLGGDCSILLGNALALRRRGRYGLLFLDGHSDFYQPETDPSGEAASMDLALVTGRGPEIVANLENLRPLMRDEDVVVLGSRDAKVAAAEGSEPLPADLLALDLATVREQGVETAAHGAVAHLEREDGPEGFWIHLDADVLDDAIMPAVDYRLPGGLSWQELSDVLRAAAASPRAVGLEVTIFNPTFDPDGTIARDLVDALVAGLSPQAARTAHPAAPSR